MCNYWHAVSCKEGLGMKTLVIIDIDGVLVDHTGRDHLIPEDMRLNSHWIPHQAAIHAGEPIIDDIDCQVGNVIAYLNGNVKSVYLTSRLEIARAATIKQLQRTATHNIAPLTFCPLEMRGMQDHREPARFKADMVINLVHQHKPDQVILIDDTAANLKAMAEAVKTFKQPTVRIYQPVDGILKQWPHEAAAAAPVKQAPGTKTLVSYVVNDVKEQLLNALDTDYPQDLIKQLVTDTLTDYEPRITVGGAYFHQALVVNGQMMTSGDVKALFDENERLRRLLASQLQLTAAMDADQNVARLQREQRARAIEDAIQNAGDWISGLYVRESELRRYADKIREGVV